MEARQTLFTSQRIMNSFWIILLSSALAVYASPTCDEEALKKCSMEMGDGKSFPTDALELKQQCSEEEPRFACIADFVERCPDFTTRALRDFYIAAEKLVNRICDGDLRDKYLRNAKCFGDILTSKSNYCIELNKEKISDGLCVYQKSVEECVSSFVKDTCGKEAFEILLELYKVTKLLAEDAKCS